MAENADNTDDTEIIDSELDQESGDQIKPEESDDETGTGKSEEELAAAAADKEAENGEVEVVLEGDEDPAPHKMPKRTRKLLERNTKLQNELGDHDEIAAVQAQEIARLQAEVNQNAIPTVMPLQPNPDDFNLDTEGFAAAQAKYQIDFPKWLNNQNATAADQAATTQARAAQAKQETDSLEAHYERADELNVSDYDDTEAALADIIGKDSVKSIAMILPNSAMVINFLGKPANKHLAAEIAKLDQTNPKAGVAKLWEYNFKLKTKPRERSNTPDPENRVEGAAGATGSIEKRMEKAAKSGNIKLYRELKAENKGVGLK